MMNLAGLKTDLVDRACLGQAFKYGVVIAEDVLASPWRPLDTTFGLEAEESGITVSWGAHPRVTYNSQATSPDLLLRSVEEDMRSETSGDGTECVSTCRPWCRPKNTKNHNKAEHTRTTTP